MTNLAIISPKEIQHISRKLLGVYVDYIRKVIKTPELGIDVFKQYEIISTDFNLDNEIIKNKIWIKEKSYGKNHIIFTLGSDLKNPIKRLGIISSCKLAHKKILVFSGNLDLEYQINYFLQIISPPEKNLYVFVEDLDNQEQFNEIVDKINSICLQENVKIKDFYPISRNLYLQTFSKVVDKLYDASLEPSETVEQQRATSKKLLSSIKDNADYTKIDVVLNFIISLAIKLIIEEPDEIKDCEDVETMWGTTTIYRFEHGDIVEVPDYPIRYDADIQIHKDQKELWHLLNMVSLLVEKREIIEWIETLPYPLASILWRYVAEVDISKKIETLVNFFEAFSIFNATIMLSTFYFDTYFYNQNWIVRDKDYLNWFKKATLGNWLVIGRKLGNEIANLLNNNEKKDEYLAYSRLSVKFLKLIINKNIYDILDNVIEIRNELSHIGVINRDLCQNILKLLTNCLNEFMRIIKDHYTTFILIKSLSMEKQGLIYTHRVIKAKGSRLPLPLDEFELSNEMDKNKLYYLDQNYEFQNHQFSHSLLPIVKLLDDNACYFYNRIENLDKKKIEEKGLDAKPGKNFKWVSYHYIKSPIKYILTSDNLSLDKILKSLSYQED